MNRIFTFTLFLALFSTVMFPVSAQQEDSFFVSCEDMPRFLDGGLEKFAEWVTEQIEYPEDAFQNKTDGRVFVSFFINEEGHLERNSIMIINSEPEGVFDDEVLRILGLSPEWTAGRHEGRPVRLKYNLPVIFKYSEEVERRMLRAAAGDGGEEETFAEYDAPVLVADRMPSFRGGDGSMFHAWLINNVRYNPEALERELEGDVILSFVVEKDGTLSNIEEVASPDPLLTNEVIRQMAQSERWEPGYIDEEPVRVKMVILVKFALSDELRERNRNRIYDKYGVDIHPKLGDTDYLGFPAWLAERIEYAPGAGEASRRVAIQIGRDGSMEYMIWGDPDPARDGPIRAALSETGKWEPAVKYDKPVICVGDIELNFSRDGRVTAAFMEKEAVKLSAEVMPSFMGGDLVGFRNWVNGRLSYPQSARQDNIQGTVIISFIIETDGSLTNIQVLQSPHPALTQEAVSAVLRSPKWTPGVQKGKNVRVKFNLPIQFVIP